MKKIFKLFAVVTVITIIFGTIYAASQQVLRLGANDPQIQLAEDTATKLDNNTKPEEVVDGKADIKASLAPFVIIYDKSGKPVASSGYLNGTIPVVPIGVLSQSSSGHTNQVTWQPEDNVRIASVVSSSKDYYVLSGRNLREVESREDKVLKLVTFGWLFTVAIICTLFLLKPSRSNSS